MRKPKLYIFDVDGTLRWTRVQGQRYPLAPNEWSLMPNVSSVLRSIPWAVGGPWLAFASNQPGVGEGLISERDAHDMIASTVHDAIGFIPDRTKIKMCTCGYDVECSSRKPNPGMLLASLQDFNVDGSEALFVGDQSIDADAARRAGIPFVWSHVFFHSSTS